MRCRATTALTCLLALAACGDDPAPPGLSADGRAGWRTYRMFCVACHAPDPNDDVPLAPPVAGSSRALLEARILRGGYPDDYRPKRDTRIMPAHPHLARDIDSLAAYLAEIKR
jgi:cytochrome c553